MAITKPSRSMLSTGISDSSDATFLTADSSENATFAGNLTVSGNLTVTGTTTQVDTVTMNAQNAVLFEGATADAHETTLTTVDPTGDRTISLPNVSGTLPVLAAASVTQISSTPEELNLLDGSSANTVVNSKAVIYGSSGELAGTLSTAAQTNITSLGTLTTLNIERNLSSDTTTSPDTVLTLGAKYTSTGADGGAGAGPRIEFKIPDDEQNPEVGSAIAGIKEVADDSDSSSGLAFYVSQNDTTLDEVLRIDHDGNVGIGTASPDYSLHVSGDGHQRIKVEKTDSGGDADISIAGPSDSTGWLLFTDRTAGNNSGVIKYVHTGDYMSFRTNGTDDRIRIASNGHVSINGTANASADGLSKMTIGSGSGDSGLSIYSGANNTSRIMFADGTSGGAQYDGFLAYQHQEQLLGFGVGSTGAYSMAIASSKEVRVGTTNDYGSRFLSYHDVSDHHSIVAENNNSSFTSDVLVASATRNTANASYRLFQCQRRGYSVVMSVNDAGNVQNLNNSFTGLSDERLKINIEDASSQWDDIKALRVRKYQWGQGNTGHNQIGLISQEVEAAGMPHLIEETDADEYQIAYNPQLEGKKVKTMKYSVLYMKAVKALQEAMARIETLEQRIADDDAVVSALENRIETIEQRLI